MLRALRIAGVAAIVTASFAAPAASARGFGDEPLYSYTWYSDASHTTQVGYAWGVCYPGYVGISPVQGAITAYEEKIQVGVCRNGEAIYM
jgi:hypothetical protein